MPSLTKGKVHHEMQSYVEQNHGPQLVKQTIKYMQMHCFHLQDPYSTEETNSSNVSNDWPLVDDLCVCLVESVNLSPSVHEYS